jgi:8-oxo-dGTP pyrophosphatase MutT (NUDIX family)
VEDQRIEELARALAARPPRRAEPEERASPAAVALLLRPSADGPELLLIRRAEREGDPWSGHMALPGGRADPGDRDAAATAARETLEEVGIDLARDGRFLGPLDVLAPMGARVPPVTVSPFVFAVPAGTTPVPNEEVALAIWVPLSELAEPGATTEYLYEMDDGTTMSFPAYGARGHIVWGLTHRILTGFLELYSVVDDAERVREGDALIPDEDHGTDGPESG